MRGIRAGHRPTGRLQDDEGGDPSVGTDVQGVAGVVVKPGDHLHVDSRGESVVGEVGLPALVGHRGFEPDVGGLGSLRWVRSYGPCSNQDPVDGRSRQFDVVAVGQVPADGVGAGIEAGVDQLLADPQHQVDSLARGRARGGVWASGAGLEGRLALGAVAGQQLIDPGAGDAVVGDHLRDGSVLDGDSGDDQAGFRHSRPWNRCPGCPGTSVRYVVRHLSGMC